MVLINYATKEIVAKVVYYGPALCGKTTNLQYIYTKLNPKKRGKMISLATESDRTLFFDFLPMELGRVQGFKVKFQLYTVPGQVFYGATRKLVLKGADAVVFVADSQEATLEMNLDSIEDMKRNLIENNLDPETIPLVIQYNKRDLNGIMEVEDLEKTVNWRGVPYTEAVAVTGPGVMDTFKEITRY
ncbi:MAG TPA: GTPase domain-containing protein, partial [Nitrospirota bacterium]